MAWTLFPDDAKQALRLKRFFMAALSYLLWLGLTYYCYRLGLVGVTTRGFAVAVLLVLLTNLAFFALLRSGLNRYWPDPSLTLPQMIVATFWVMFLVALAPKVRGTLLLLYLVVFLFGVFRLRRREYLGLTVLVLVGYVLVVLWDVYQQTEAEPLSQEGLHFMVLAVSLFWVAFFGSYVGKLRETVSRRNTELAAALAKNRELAIHDDLTGAYNRRHIIEALEQERRRALRTGRGFSICLMDLDHFKDVNDRHGHLMGDEVLKQFAERVIGEVRAIDRMGRDGAEGNETFGRYGGEEFLLVLPETDLKGAELCAERIRTKIAEGKFGAGNLAIHITVSVGITGYQSGEDTRNTLARADQALYAAKDSGRDQVKTV
ncbi:MAG TPA: GGDEF domain-containing protein [Gammaproteobacteria bacterium]|nr:GGDEF domain-containing protein [Gammaproteobacteria bacterium]